MQETEEIFEEEVKIRSLQREDSETFLEAETVTPFEELDENVKLALHCASDKKAFNMVAIDLREIASFTEFFIIASGANQRQVQAIADEITEQLREQLKSRVVRVEGYQTGEWVLLDYGDFVVHIFEAKAREFYDLERLWRDAKKVEIPKEIS
ncbi:MAG: ribosome silencing factor [Acidobacteria bacterium]|nr:ribosome silencing factor [Acidobacteriota bacterium]